MVKTKLRDFDDLFSLYEQVLSIDDLEDATAGIKTSQPGLDLDTRHELIDILKQRNSQRDRLLEFLIHLTIDIVAFFIILVFSKAYCKLAFDVDIVSDELLATVAVSLFVEVIAVIRGITKALWNEKDVLNSPLIEKLLNRHKK